MIDIKKLIHSFGYAGKGIRFFFAGNQNAVIELGVGILVVMAGTYFRISRMEWLFVLLNIASVLSLEALNTALEKLCDKLHPQHDQTIARVKDIAAGAVLIASLIAAVSGIVIFAPHL